jgi:N-acetylmuramoyl-L-alanine amidase
MGRSTRCFGFCSACVLVATIASAVPPVRTMYNDALAREQSVRAAIAAPDATAAALADVHALIATYESIVKHYPASGYSDNALWQAGRLALDAFARFGQTADRDAGVRLLRRLAAMYPASSLVPQVPPLLAALDSGAAAAPPAAETKSSLPPARDAAASPSPAATTRVATIREIRRTVLPDAVRVTIELDGEVPFHDERIADPDRVFLDLPRTRPSAALVDRTLRFASDADVVRQVRIGRHPNNTTRVVLDAGGVATYSVYPLYGPYRLVIDCVRTPAAAIEATPALLASRILTTGWTRRFPAGAPINGAMIARASAPEEPVKAVIVAPAPTAPPIPSAPLPSTSVAGGLSIARQLGLGVSRIVIDPGHGGHDPGAKGKGVTEAELVLDIALRVEKLLEKVAGVEVILTRRTDDFIPLPERTAIANRAGADLFLSIHANASPSAQARGIETYFLNFATNTSAAAVAARENATSTLAMGEMPDIVKAIALNNKVDESRDFATHVQRALFERLRTSNRTLKDLGVKQAPFVVLIGATMPSVLAEISFVTNPQEARLLKGNAYRQKIAESLFNAIRKYQTSLKGTTAVALQ